MTDTLRAAVLKEMRRRKPRMTIHALARLLDGKVSRQSLYYWLSEPSQHALGSVAVSQVFKALGLRVAASRSAKSAHHR